MKAIKFLIIGVFSLVLLGLPAFAETCCEKAKAKGETCKHPCCVEAAKAGKACEKCAPKPAPKEGDVKK